MREALALPMASPGPTGPVLSVAVTECRLGQYSTCPETIYRVIYWYRCRSSTQILWTRPVHQI